MDRVPSTLSPTSQPPPGHLHHTQGAAVAKEYEAVNENSSQHDNKDDDDRGLDQLVRWLGSLVVDEVRDLSHVEKERNGASEINSTVKSADGQKSKGRRRRNKTPFQQEYNRLSQRERRQERRNKRRREKRADEGMEIKDEETNDFLMLWGICLVYDGKWASRWGCRAVWDAGRLIMAGVAERAYMRQYPGCDDLYYPTSEELGAYLIAKHKEFVFLRRRLATIDSTERHLEEWLRAGNVNLQAAKARRRALAWADFLQRYSGVRYRLEIVRHAAAVIPDLIERVEKEIEKIVSIMKGAGMNPEYRMTEDSRQHSSAIADEGYVVIQHLPGGNGRWGSLVFDGNF